MNKLIQHEYAVQTAAHRGTSNQRQARLAEISPEYARLRSEYLRKQQLASSAALGDEDAYRQAMADVERLAADIEAQLPAILEKHGLPADYLQPQYNCEICKDTGFVGGYDRRLCSCAKAKLHQTDDKEYRYLPHFADYDDGIFKDESQREKTGKLKDYLIKYAEEFPHNEKKDIFLQSATGLGKTFLLGCTARAIGERGFSIKMLTAYELSALFRGEHIDHQPCMPMLKRVDFLLIDDLGVESIYKNISHEYMYILLNERGRRGKATAISSNLTIENLQAKYEQRLMSRMLDKAKGMFFVLEGKDLRLSK